MTLGTVPGSDYDFPVGMGYGVKIAGKLFRLAPNSERPVRIFTQEAQAARSNDSANALENTLNIGYTFARSDLSGGEGLETYPQVSAQRRSELDDSRFFDSKNIDVRSPGDGVKGYELSLSPLATTFYTPTGSPADMCASSDGLYVAEGSNVQRFDDLANATPDDTDALGSAVKEITCDQADNVVALLTNGDVYYRPRDGTGFTQVTPLTGLGVNEEVEEVFMVKERILFVTSDSSDTAQAWALKEVDFGVGGTPTSPTFSFSVTTTVDTFQAEVEDIIDGGTAILCATSDGYIRSYVPEVQTAGQAPVLVVRARSQMPNGEFPFAIGHNFGRLLIATRETLATNGDVRLYSGTLLDERFDYIVGELVLLREFPGSQEDPTRFDRMISDRNNIWCSIRESDGVSHLWRYDVTTTGLFRYTQIEASASGHSLVKFHDRVLWNDGTSIGYLSTTDYQASGWLITPNVNFGLDTDINWVSAIINATINEGQGIQVELFGSTDPDAIYDYEDAGWIRLVALSANSLSGKEIMIDGLTGKSLALQIRLTATNAGQYTPVVTKMSTRALPTKRDFVLELPINVSDYIEAPLRRPLRVAGWGDVIHRTILDFDGQWVEAELYDPPISFRGVVDQILEPVTYIGKRGSSSVFCLVRLIGSRVGTGTTVGSAATAVDEGLGLGSLGIASLGIDG